MWFDIFEWYPYIAMIMGIAFLGFIVVGGITLIFVTIYRINDNIHHGLVRFVLIGLGYCLGGFFLRTIKDFY